MKHALWTLVQADHDLAWDLINRITGGPGGREGGPEEHRQVAKMLVALESSHEAAEELVIWPAVRRLCPDGDDLVLEATSQERQAKRALNELEHIKAGNTEFDECANTVASHAREHITYEQNQIWPRLADHLIEEEAQALARAWVNARRHGPTRPHPHTPPGPLLLATLGQAAARLDRTRDRLTGRQVPEPPELAAVRAEAG